MFSIRLFYLYFLVAEQLAVSASLFPTRPQNLFYQARPKVAGFEVEPQGIRHFFQPPTTYETYGAGRDIASSLMQDNLQDTAVAVLQEQLGLPNGQVAYHSGYSSDTTGANYAYLKQIHNGIPFVNAVSNIVMKNGKILSFGSSFVRIDEIAAQQPTVHISAAIRTAEETFGAAYNDYPTTLGYYAQWDGSVALVHIVHVQDIDNAIWLQVHVDAHSGEVLSSINFIAESGYQVVPIDKHSVLDDYTYLTNPQDVKASPLGWHDMGDGQSKDTTGNNVISFIDKVSNTTPQSGNGLAFKYSYDTTKEPKAGQNQDAARVNAFYVINKVHDIAYRYGFTEKAFNFQMNNFGKGGKGSDPVFMSVQNSNGYNNANFGTGPDGELGRCNMYLWNMTTPFRDGDLDNTIVIHEMTHGISNRLTGGGTAACLQNLESRSLGEGWSDTMANWVQQTSAQTKDFVTGRYAMGKQGGSRNWPYSTDLNINPLVYSHFNDFLRFGSHHLTGQIWANMLHNVYAALVLKHGYSDTAVTNPDGSEGNVVFMHLFIDHLAIQPCHPTFATSRTAWIQAEQTRYNGKYRCTLWKGFASRGLGIDAVTTLPYADGFDIPADCK